MGAAGADPAPKRPGSPLPEVPAKRRRALIKTGLCILQQDNRSVLRWYSELSVPTATRDFPAVDVSPVAPTNTPFTLPNSPRSFYPPPAYVCPAPPPMIPPPYPLYFHPYPSAVPYSGCRHEFGGCRECVNCRHECTSGRHDYPHCRHDSGMSLREPCRPVYEVSRTPKPINDLTGTSPISLDPTDRDPTVKTADATDDSSVEEQVVQSSQGIRSGTTPRSAPAEMRSTEQKERPREEIYVEVSDDDSEIRAIIVGDEGTDASSADTPKDESVKPDETPCERKKSTDNDPLTFSVRDTPLRPVTKQELTRLQRLDITSIRPDSSSTDRWTWSGMIYELNLWPMPVGMEVVRTSPLLWRLFQKVDLEQDRFYCLIRRMELPLDDVLRLLLFYYRQGIFFHILKYVSPKTIQRTIGSRQRTQKLMRTCHGPSIFSYPCLDCSSFVLFHQRASTGRKRGGPPRSHIEGACSGCGRDYNPKSADVTLETISPWEFKPRIKSVEHLIALDDAVNDEDDDSTQAEFTRLVTMWSEYGALAISYLASILGIIGPGLNAIVSRLGDERLCSKCCLGVISGSVAQTKFQCSWCLSTLLTNPKAIPNESCQKHAEYAESVILEITGSRPPPPRLVEEEEPELEPLSVRAIDIDEEDTELEALPAGAIDVDEDEPELAPLPTHTVDGYKTEPGLLPVSTSAVDLDTEEDDIQSAQERQKEMEVGEEHPSDGRLGEVRASDQAEDVCRRIEPPFVTEANEFERASLVGRTLGGEDESAGDETPEDTAARFHATMKSICGDELTLRDCPAPLFKLTSDDSPVPF